MTQVNHVIAIVVTYQPDSKALYALLDALQNQVAAIVVVDNASDIFITKQLQQYQNLHCIRLSSNEGIGKAQNIGIQWARSQNASHILLCDQDSVPQHDMLDALLSAEKDALAAGVNVAAVGPRYHDPVNNSLSGFVIFKRLHFSRVSCQPNQSYIPCAFVIASGCLIRMSCIEHIGDMDESLFIDHVDTDWCLRAQALNYQIIGACNAIMQHDLGESRVSIDLLGRRRQISVHQPYRQYYVLRNSILLYQRAYTSWRWIGGDLIRLVQRFVFFSLFEGSRWQNFKMMLKGIKDGLLKRTGKLAE